MSNDFLFAEHKERCALCDDAVEEAMAEESDPVNNPAHYTVGTIEVLSFIEDQGMDYREGNIIKYVCRAKYKGNYLEDLKKARFYLNRLIEEAEHDSERV